jgi:hypothetical protein
MGGVEVCVYSTTYGGKGKQNPSQSPFSFTFHPHPDPLPQGRGDTFFLRGATPLLNFPR